MVGQLADWLQVSKSPSHSRNGADCCPFFATSAAAAAGLERGPDRRAIADFNISKDLNVEASSTHGSFAQLLLRRSRIMIHLKTYWRLQF
jgi:hypothetical protein